MKKKTYVLGMAVLAAALLALAGVAQSAMWVGGQIGGNFVPSSTSVSVGGIDIDDTQFKPSVMGGAAIGYDFVNTGFGAYAWPDWMKYFSVFTDFTYNRLDVWSGDTGLGALLIPGARLEGYELMWSFMLMAHYPFFPDSEVPAGRLRPYIAVGPGIMWSGLDLGKFGVGRSDSTNIALIVEPGIRFMALKNVSIDAAFRYRYAVPSYDFNGVDVDIDPLHQLGFLVRANYHF